MTISIEYTWMKFSGPINVVRTTPQELKGKSVLVHILIGPTGSGKSAFIESLSTNGELSISKDSLESVTQEVVCYNVVNLAIKDYPEDQFILMDTPGFLDTKLSESRITKMILSMLDALCTSAEKVVVSIFFFHPITSIRMGRSKRDAVKLLRAFAESFEAQSINVITTMWNTILTPMQTVGANQRLRALKLDIFQQSEDMRIFFNKFEFRRESAVSILSGNHGGWHHDNVGDVNPEFQFLALNNLLQRIENAQQQVRQLTEDRRNASIPGKEDHLLLEVIDEDESVASAALVSFSYDLCVISPEAYQSVFPGIPFPPHPTTPPPSPPPSPSFKTRLHQKITRPVPLKSVFRMRK